MDNRLNPNIVSYSKRTITSFVGRGWYWIIAILGSSFGCFGDNSIKKFNRMESAQVAIRKELRLLQARQVDEGRLRGVMEGSITQIQDLVDKLVEKVMAAVEEKHQQLKGGQANLMQRVNKIWMGMPEQSVMVSQQLGEMHTKIEQLVNQQLTGVHISLEEIKKDIAQLKKDGLAQEGGIRRIQKGIKRYEKSIAHVLNNFMESFRKEAGNHLAEQEGLKSWIEHELVNSIKQLVNQQLTEVHRDFEMIKRNIQVEIEAYKAYTGNSFEALKEVVNGLEGQIGKEHQHLQSYIDELREDISKNCNDRFSKREEEVQTWMEQLNTNIMQLQNTNYSLYQQNMDQNQEINDLKDSLARLSSNNHSVNNAHSAYVNKKPIHNLPFQSISIFSSSDHTSLKSACSRNEHSQNLNESIEWLLDDKVSANSASNNIIVSDEEEVETDSASESSASTSGSSASTSGAMSQSNSSSTASKIITTKRNASTTSTIFRKRSAKKSLEPIEENLSSTPIKPSFQVRLAQHINDEGLDKHGCRYTQMGKRRRLA